MDSAAFRAAATFLLLAVSVPSSAGAAEDVYFRAAGGGSHPVMPSLSDELSAQGVDGLSIGWTAGVSLGRTFSDRAWAAELWAEIGRFPSFAYVNEYEEFEADLTAYSFLLVGKRRLLPPGGRLTPWIGLGAGYGQTTIARGGGRIDGFQAAGLLQLESRLRDNISLLVEGSWLIMPGSREFDSPFLEGSAQDRILDSGGDPLSEQYSSWSLRVGVVVRLRPPDPYGG